MAEIFLPAQMAVTGVGVPSVCTRHGEPAVDRPRAIFQSKPPPWSYLLLLVAVIAFLVVSLALRKTLNVPGWPLCARCRKRRQGLRLAALGLFVATVVLAALAFANSANSGLVGALFFVGFLCFLASLVVFGRSGVAVLARAEVTRDGTALRLRDVAPAFVAALPAVPPAPPGWAPPPAQWAPPPAPPGPQQPRY